MNFYRNASIVMEEVSLIDDSGLVPLVVSVNYRILDETGTQIVATTAATFASGDTSVVVTVSALNNTLATGKIKGLRVVELALTLDTGAISYILQNYALELEQSLVALTNSYQTLNEAKLLLLDMPDMFGWESASDKKKEAAMIEAFDRIGKLSFNIYGLLIPSRENTVVSNRLIVDFNDSQAVSFYKVRPSLNTIPLIEFNNLPNLFISAVKKAQISEADVILGGDPIHKKREEGLLSNSVGESSTMFRPGKPLTMAVSRRTLDYLAGWVTFNVRMSRSN